MQSLWDALEFETQKLGLADRTIAALVEAGLGLKIRNVTYRKAADVSHNLASRDLKELVDAGLLLPKGEKRGRYYLASPRLREIGKDATRDESHVIADPFELTGYLPGLGPRTVSPTGH